jgi:hypothetical protein
MVRALAGYTQVYGLWILTKVDALKARVLFEKGSSRLPNNGYGIFRIKYLRQTILLNICREKLCRCLSRLKRLENCQVKCVGGFDGMFLCKFRCFFKNTRRHFQNEKRCPILEEFVDNTFGNSLFETFALDCATNGSRKLRKTKITNDDLLG